MKEFRLTLELVPGHAPENRRTDQLLLEKLREISPGLSRAMLKKFFVEDRIIRLTPGGDRRARASDQLSDGRHDFLIRGDFPSDSTPTSLRSERGCFLKVLYEDTELLVLDKTSGTPSVPHSTTETETAVGAALAHFPELHSIGESLSRGTSGPSPGLEPGILHRLDTGTSGAIAFAKTPASFARLRAAWSSGGVVKLYRALASPQRPDLELPKLPITLRPLLAHDARSARRMILVDPEHRMRSYRGKPLNTLTELLAAKTAAPPAEGAVLASELNILDLTIRIQTGVMHQIRCTLAGIGWPILGDPIYGGAPSTRLWLHAWKLEIPRADGSRIWIEAPLPDGWPKN